jgi:hypothetical protein
VTTWFGQPIAIPAKRKSSRPSLRRLNTGDGAPFATPGARLGIAACSQAVQPELCWGRWPRLHQAFGRYSGRSRQLLRRDPKHGAHRLHLIVVTMVLDEAEAYVWAIDFLRCRAPCAGGFSCRSNEWRRPSFLAAVMIDRPLDTASSTARVSTHSEEVRRLRRNN